MYRIRVEAGNSIYPYKFSTAKCPQAIVEEVLEDGSIRVVPEEEWQGWPNGQPQPFKLEKPALKKPVQKTKAVSEKKPAPKKKKANKQPAIPDDSDSLETVDVSAL